MFSKFPITNVKILTMKNTGMEYVLSLRFVQTKSKLKPYHGPCVFSICCIGRLRFKVWDCFTKNKKKKLKKTCMSVLEISKSIIVHSGNKNAGHRGTIQRSFRRYRIPIFYQRATRQNEQTKQQSTKQ